MQELDLDADHPVVVLAALVHAVVVAAAAVDLRLPCALGHSQCGTDGGHAHADSFRSAGMIR